MRPELKYKMKKITCPVFFRLLYSSGIRTTEARYLKREDVDLEHGVLNIRKSKGYDQHYVALHKSMTELLKQYDKMAESIRPDRTYFLRPLMGSIIPGSGLRRLSSVCGKKRMENRIKRLPTISDITMPP